jgi:1-acyl-sn-glycerol-3-phosphate acyltransferase
MAQKRSKLAEGWYELAAWTMRLLFILFYRIRFFGSENIPDSGPVIIVSNHQSHFDPPAVGISSPRQCFFMARHSLFKWKPFGRLIGSLGAMPIDQRNPLSGIKLTLKCLKGGGVVLLFPEGTRTVDGQMKRLQSGFVTLIRRTGATVVPAAIDGAFTAWPRKKRFPGRSTIHIRFGKPILPELAADLDDEQLVDQVQSRIEACLGEIREHPSFSLKRPFSQKKGAGTIAAGSTSGYIY